MRAISAANTLSPAFGGSLQRIGRKGSRFALDVSIPAMAAKSCGIELIADLLRGETETLVAPVPDYTPATTWGSPLVNGYSLAGSSLPIDGLPASRAVPKGKFLSLIIDGQRFVHMVTAAATASTGGGATLAIWPALRKSPANNAVVELLAPKIEGFIQPGQEWSTRRIGAVGMSFTIEERE